MQRKVDEFEGLKFLYLAKTRIANPSIWEGNTVHNEKIFARFLSGELCVGKGNTIEEAKHNLVSVIDFTDDETDFLSTDELLRIMRWRKTVIEPKYSQSEIDS